MKFHTLKKRKQKNEKEDFVSKIYVSTVDVDLNKSSNLSIKYIN